MLIQWTATQWCHYIMFSEIFNEVGKIALKYIIGCYTLCTDIICVCLSHKLTENSRSNIYIRQNFKKIKCVKPPPQASPRTSTHKNINGGFLWILASWELYFLFLHIFRFFHIKHVFSFCNKKFRNSHQGHDSNHGKTVLLYVLNLWLT